MEWKSSAWMTSRVIDPFAACVIKSFHATSGKLGSRLSYGSGIKPFVVDFTLCHRRQTCQAGIQFSSSNMKLLFFLSFFFLLVLPLCLESTMAYSATHLTASFVDVRLSPYWGQEDNLGED